MHRVEVNLKGHLPDARGAGLVKDILDLGITTVSDIRVVDVYWLDADLSPDTLDLICRSLMTDPVTQEYRRFISPADVKGGKVDKKSRLAVAQYLNQADTPADPHVVREMMLFTNDLDAGRKQSFRAVHPELIELLAEDGFV